MAKFNAEGIDGLMLSLEEFSEIPDSVVEQMLDAAGEVVVAAHKKSIRSFNLVDTEKLLGSIKAHKKVGTRNGIRERYVLVYPTGKHGTRKRKKVTKAYCRRPEHPRCNHHQRARGHYDWQRHRAVPPGPLRLHPSHRLQYPHPHTVCSPC